jgi:hypothetical protein
MTRTEKIEMAVLAATMHVKPDYRSPHKLSEFAQTVTKFVERELDRVGPAIDQPPH